MYFSYFLFSHLLFTVPIGLLLVGLSTGSCIYNKYRTHPMTSSNTTVHETTTLVMFNPAYDPTSAADHNESTTNVKDKGAKRKHRRPSQIPVRSYKLR